MVLMVFVMMGAPSIYALSQSDFTNDEHMRAMMINCAADAGRYEDMYSGLKNSDYGRHLNLTVGICNHNTLIYEGLCEKHDNMTSDAACDIAQLYLKFNGLQNETRPQSFITDWNM